MKCFAWRGGHQLFSFHNRRRVYESRFCSLQPSFTSHLILTCCCFWSFRCLRYEMKLRSSNFHMFNYVIITLDVYFYFFIFSVWGLQRNCRMSVLGVWGITQYLVFPLFWIYILSSFTFSSLYQYFQCFFHAIVIYGIHRKGVCPLRCWFFQTQSKKNLFWLI